MPTVHNYLELKYLVRVGIDRLPQLRNFHVVSKVDIRENKVMVSFPKKVKDEYVKEVIDEIMENEFSATPIEDNFESGYKLEFKHITNPESLETITILSLPQYIHEYLEKDNGEWE